MPFKRSEIAQKNCLIGALFYVLVVAGGCQSSTVTHDEAQSVLLSRIDVRQQLKLTSAQLDATMVTMNTISGKQSDGLVSAFTDYGVQVEALDGSVADLNRVCASSKALTDAYFDTAAAKIDLIKDMDLKSRADSRRQKAVGLAQTIDGDTRTVELAYQLLVQRLRDIQAYLAADLTSGCVRSIQDQFAQTDSDVTPLKAKSDQFAYDLELGNELMNTGDLRPATTSTTEFSATASTTEFTTSTAATTTNAASDTTTPTTQPVQTP